MIQRFLVTYLIKKIHKNQNFQNYLKNSSWMLFEYMLKIVSGIFVGIYIARYLGPDQFGILNYVIAIVAVFLAIGRLGMDAILVRELARNPDRRKNIMATSFWLMLIASFLAFLAIFSLSFFIEGEKQVRLYIWVLSLCILLQVFMVIDYNFQSQVKARYSSIAKSFALIISSISKLILVWLSADLHWFVLFYVFDHLVVAIFLLIVHFAKKQTGFFQGYDKTLVMPLLGSAWPMILSALAVVLYSRIDQIMIRNMLSDKDLGIYSAAVKIYEGWIIIPYILSVSVLPAIVSMRMESKEKYEQKMAALFSILFWLSALVAMLVSIFGEAIVYYTFGQEYLSGVSVLSIVMWSTLFASIGSISARYLTVENMEKKIAFRTIAGLFLNVILNLLMIPLYGVEGAAMATLITIFAVNYLINYMDKDLKQLVSICNAAITMRWLWNGK